MAPFKPQVDSCEPGPSLGSECRAHLARFGLDILPAALAAEAEAPLEVLRRLTAATAGIDKAASPYIYDLQPGGSWGEERFFSSSKSS